MNECTYLSYIFYRNIIIKTKQLYKIYNNIVPIIELIFLYEWSEIVDWNIIKRIGNE